MVSEICLLLGRGLWFLNNSIISQAVRRFLISVTKNAVFIRLVAFPKHLFICNKDKEKDCEYHKLITTSHKWRLRHLLYRLSRIYAKCNVSFRGHYYIKCPYILTFLFLLILPLFSFILSSFQSYIYLYIIVIYFSS